MSGTFGDRLDIARRQYWEGEGDGNRSWRALSRAMRTRQVKGSAFPSIKDYRDGSTTPDINWIEEAADELGVQKKWLAWSEGQPTPLEEEWSVEPEEPSREERFRKEVAGRFPEVAHLSPKARDLFFSVAASYILSAPDAESLDDPTTREAAVELCGDLLFLVRLPQKLGAWGFRNVGTATAEQADGMAISMLGVLRGYMSPVRGGRPLGSSSDSLIRVAREAVERREAADEEELRKIEGLMPEPQISRRETDE